MSNAPLLPPAPPPLLPKQGLSPLVWVGIVLGSVLLVLVVLGILAFGFIKKKVDLYTKNPEKAAAEMLVRVHPDLEILAQNDEKGEMTIRVKGGETLTARYNEIAKGKFSFKDAQGDVIQLGGKSDLSEVSSWVPQVAGLSDIRAFQNIRNGKVAGFYAGHSSDSPEAIEAIVEAEAHKLGLSSSSSSSVSLGKKGHITRSYSDSLRELSVNVTNLDGNKRLVTISYREK